MADGYTPEPRTYNLDFAEPSPVAGLEAKLRHATLGERLAFDELRFTPATTPKESTAKERKIAEVLADRLISWNVKDQAGQPVATTVEGILSQEDWVISALLNAYVDALVGRPRPLDDQEPTDTSPGMELMNSIPVQPLTPPATP